MVNSYLISPNPEDSRLTESVEGIDQKGQLIETSVTVERPLTLFLNGQEIVTMMTIGDYPEYLAVGYLLNQNMLHKDDSITAIDYDAACAFCQIDSNGLSCRYPYCRFLSHERMAPFRISIKGKSIGYLDFTCYFLSYGNF